MIKSKLNNLFTAILLVITLTGCTESGEHNSNFEGGEIIIVYNLIEPASGIYVVTEKGVEFPSTENNFYEKNYYRMGNLAKVERYNHEGRLCDDLNTSAVTMFEYDSQRRVKFVSHFDRQGNKALDKTFGYWSVEYVYDESDRVFMELHRDENSKLLPVPRDASGEIVKRNFISPVLVYQYEEDNLLIKAFDENFNLLKEAYSEKPCIPFIDCGE